MDLKRLPYSKIGAHFWAETGEDVIRLWTTSPYQKVIYPKNLAFHGPKLGNDFGALLHRTTKVLLLDFVKSTLFSTSWPSP